MLHKLNQNYQPAKESKIKHPHFTEYVFHISNVHENGLEFCKTLLTNAMN